jgi:hypothetical protein
MRRVALVLLIAVAACATGCVGSGSGSGGSGTRIAVSPSQIEVTYFGALRRCAAGTSCDTPPLPKVACPAGARCVPPARDAELVRCPGSARSGIRCYALPPSERAGHDPWVILQQRDLSCLPARGGYADPAAACRALGDYLRRLNSRGPQVCMCPIQLWQSLATGTFRGRRVGLDMSACATCGMGKAANSDRILLTPALTA